MTELESARERLERIYKSLSPHPATYSSVLMTPQDAYWLCDQLEGFLNGETVKRLEAELEEAKKGHVHWSKYVNNARAELQIQLALVQKALDDERLMQAVTMEAFHKVSDNRDSRVKEAVAAERDRPQTVAELREKLKGLEESLAVDGKRSCTKCNSIKPLTEFHKKSDGVLGHRRTCKACDTKERFNWYHGRNGKLIAKENVKKHRKRNNYPGWSDPVRQHARTLVQAAIRSGKINRLPCGVCGEPRSQAHHSDYSKPLEVTFLCSKHHREADMAMSRRPPEEVNDGK